MADAAPPDAVTAAAGPKRPVVSSTTKFTAPPKGGISQAISMCTFIFAMQLPLKQPEVVLAVQVVFAIVAALVFLCIKRLPDAVARAEAAGQQLVYYPLEDPLANAENPLMALMSGGGDEEKKAVKWERLTLAELEAKLAERKQNAVMSLVMPAGLSIFMKIHYLAASQVILAPLSLYDDPLVRKYVLALVGVPPMEAPSPQVGIYGELREAPPAVGDAPATAAPAPAAPAAAAAALTADSATAAAAAAAAAPAAPGAAKLTASELEMEKAIMDVWESREPLDLGHLSYLLKQGRSVNASLTCQPLGMTSIMAVCGSAANGGAEAAELLALGADPFQADGEGHTALHYAALHGRASAVDAVAAAYSPAGFALREGAVVRLGPGCALPEQQPQQQQRTLAQGLALKCHKGLTALATARAMAVALRARIEGGAEADAGVVAAARATLAGMPATIAALERAEAAAGAAPAPAPAARNPALAEAAEAAAAPAPAPAAQPASAAAEPAAEAEAAPAAAAEAAPAAAAEPSAAAAATSSSSATKTLRSRAHRRE